MFRVRNILRVVGKSSKAGEIYVYLQECKLGCRSGSCVVKDAGGICAANQSRCIDAGALIEKIKDSKRAYMIGTVEAFLQHKNVFENHFSPTLYSDAAEDCLTGKTYIGMWMYPK